MIDASATEAGRVLRSGANFCPTDWQLVFSVGIRSIILKDRCRHASVLGDRAAKAGNISVLKVVVHVFHRE
jgi:hypothetical protein